MHAEWLFSLHSIPYQARSLSIPVSLVQPLSSSSSYKLFTLLSGLPSMCARCTNCNPATMQRISPPASGFTVGLQALWHTQQTTPRARAFSKWAAFVTRTVSMWIRWRFTGLRTHPELDFSLRMCFTRSGQRPVPHNAPCTISSPCWTTAPHRAPRSCTSNLDYFSEPH